MGIEYPAPEQALYGQITPQKYDALLLKLKSDPDASSMVVGDDSGSVTYQKIGFAWTYDEAKAELTLTITADHNWKARIAGNQAIFEELNSNVISTL